MCLWLLRTTQSLLRLVSRPLLIVQQTTQRRDESRAGECFSKRTFNHRKPGANQPAVVLPEQERRSSFVLTPSLRDFCHANKDLWPSNGDQFFQKAPAFNFQAGSNLLGFHLHAFMPIQRSCVHSVSGQHRD